MDKKDFNLLKELMKNSRVSLTQLAKKLNISREVATYRLKKLEKNKIIFQFIAEIDIKMLGFVEAAVFVNVKAIRQKEFKEFLVKTNFVSWVAELSGIWNFGISIIGKTNEELDQKFLQIYNEFKDYIVDHRFTLHRKSTFYYEKYFSSKPDQKINKKITGYKIDQKDKKIIEELSKNSRIDCVSLATKINLTAPAVSSRIKKLEKSGYIQNYSIFLDVSKLGLFQYSVFVINKDINEKKKLIDYLSQNKNISFIAEYVGDPFIEFGLFISDPYELRDKLQEIEETFPNNRIIEISLFQKEFVSIGPPRCIFE